MAINKVGFLSDEIINSAGSQLSSGDVFLSDGLKKHMINHGHSSCLPFIPRIQDIINNPDYVGKSPNESGNSIELVKVFTVENKNIEIAIKLDSSNNYLYVSTMYELQPLKLTNRLKSGRLKKL